MRPVWRAKSLRLGLRNCSFLEVSWIEAATVPAKGRARWVGEGDPLAPLQFIDELFGDLTLSQFGRGPAIAHSRVFATIPLKLFGLHPGIGVTFMPEFVRVHAGTPFGIIPGSTFTLAGIPKGGRVIGCVHADHFGLVFLAGLI